MRPLLPERLIIGLAEYVDIPEFRVAGLRAKIDTGARSSALHVENLREIGRGRVAFDVRLHRSLTERRVSVEAPITRRGLVRSSTGETRTRIFVTVKVRIGSHVRVVEMGLVDRAHMIYRMLLGRTALGSDFLVDPCRRYLMTRTSVMRGPATAARVSSAAPTRPSPKRTRGAE